MQFDFFREATFGATNLAASRQKAIRGYELIEGFFVNPKDSRLFWAHYLYDLVINLYEILKVVLFNMSCM